LPRHDHVYHSPKRGQKSPPRTTSKTSKHTSHVSRVVSPHNPRSSKKSSHTRPKYSRSPSKNIHNHSRSSSPVKDARANKKHSDSDSPEGYSSVSKKKKETKSPAKQFNPKVKLSETSLFAELVKDRQMRELAMKCLTQVNTKTINENEVVEIHDDSDNEQNNTNIKDSNIKDSNLKLLNNICDDIDSCRTVETYNKRTQNSVSEFETSNIKSVTSSILDLAPTISVENQSPSVSKEEFLINGVDNFLEPIPTLTSIITSPDKKMPEVIENKDSISKMPLPMPPVYPIHDELSPDSEYKSSRKSIKDLPLPPGKFVYIYSIT
jgi:cyclin-dependent kinase 12/13